VAIVQYFSKVYKKLLRSSVNFLPMRLRALVKNIPVLAAFQRWLVQSVLSGEPFLHTINAGPAKGLRFEVLLPLDKAIWTGTYESDVANAISQGVHPGDVCYDIGGFRGYMAGVMALHGAGEVIVFEPLPVNQEALGRLCDLNAKLPIEIRPNAVGKVDGVIGFKVMTDLSMGKLQTSCFQPGALMKEEIQVTIRSLDSLVACGEIRHPNLMKIDVEGAELDVLLGAANILRDSRPLIYLEAHSAKLENACTQELEKHRYNVRRLESKEPQSEQTRHLIATPV